MINFQDFKGATAVGYSTILLVDDVSDNHSFGFTDSTSKILCNMKMIESYLHKVNLEERLINSQYGLTTLFPLGRYIVILELKRDKSVMRMWFIDFRTEYYVINEKFKGIFSKGISTQFKSIKYHLEELFKDEDDCVMLNTSIEPPIE